MSNITISLFIGTVTNLILCVCGGGGGGGREKWILCKNNFSGQYLTKIYFFCFHITLD